MDDVTPNVIIFGESGTGKSSLVNMMKGSQEAKVGNNASGVTLGTTCYPRLLGGQQFNIYDTAGLSEGESGSVTANQALSNLWNLICSLDRGIHLIIFVIRAGRITKSTSHNYHLFYDALCQRKVPIILVVNGLEHQKEPMNSWWNENCALFGEYNMAFDEVACITSLSDSNEIETKKRYIASTKLIKNLILDKHKKQHWNYDKVGWAQMTMVRTVGFFSTRLSLLAADNQQKAVIQALEKYGGMTKKEAMDWWAKEVPKKKSGSGRFKAWW